MAVTEALVRGIAVIASDVGGVPEALGVAESGDLPGVLVPANDAEALAAALRRWVEAPDLRRALRDTALIRRAELPTWDVTVDDVVDALAVVMA